MKCEHCGRPMVGARSTKRFCSPSCRLAHWRGQTAGEESVPNPIQIAGEAMGAAEPVVAEPVRPVESRTPRKSPPRPRDLSSAPPEMIRESSTTPKRWPPNWAKKPDGWDGHDGRKAIERDPWRD